MLTHPLAERLRALGMAAMADTFLEMQNSSAAADLTREDWLGLLLDREVTARDNKTSRTQPTAAPSEASAERRGRGCRLPHTTARPRSQALFLKLAGCDWIREKQPLSPDRSNRCRDMMQYFTILLVLRGLFLSRSCARDCTTV